MLHITYTQARIYQFPTANISDYFLTSKLQTSNWIMLVFPSLCMLSYSSSTPFLPLMFLLLLPKHKHVASKKIWSYGSTCKSKLVCTWEMKGALEYQYRTLRHFYVDYFTGLHKALLKSWDTSYNITLSWFLEMAGQEDPCNLNYSVWVHLIMMGGALSNLV